MTPVLFQSGKAIDAVLQPGTPVPSILVTLGSDRHFAASGGKVFLKRLPRDGAYEACVVALSAEPEELRFLWLTTALIRVRTIAQVRAMAQPPDFNSATVHVNRYGDDMIWGKYQAVLDFVFASHDVQVVAHLG